MKKIFTIFKTVNSGATLKKVLGITFLFVTLFMTGCYEWRNIFQPETANINSYFDVYLSAQDDGNPDNDWTNADLHDLGLFGVMLPDGWTVQDSIPFAIICTEPGYDNEGFLFYSAERSQTLEDSLSSPDGYYWWGSDTGEEASLVYFDSLYLEPRIYTGSEEGDYFLRYAIGDVDYWDRNPADNVSEPIPITLIDNTGVEELIAESNVSIYPIPTSGQLNIKLKDYGNELIEVDIFDLTGKIVMQSKLTGNHTVVGLENLEKGVYFLQLIVGETAHSHKIVVN